MFVAVPAAESGVVEELSFCGGSCPLALMRCLMGRVGAALRVRWRGAQSSRGGAQSKKGKTEETTKRQRVGNKGER